VRECLQTKYIITVQVGFYTNLSINLMEVYGFIIPSHLRAIAIKEGHNGLFNPDNYGWGNGYVAVPKGHPWYGLSFEEIPCTSDYEELTYSNHSEPTEWVAANEGAELLQDVPQGEYWAVGFDTGHYWNNIHNSSKERVIEMTKALMSDALNAI
jgi:hypothetical protein